MVEVSIEEGTVALDVKGLDKLWAFKSRLQIPLSNIKGVRQAPTIAQGWWKGFRVPGTNIPGVIIAGTFYQDGKRIFWDVHHPEKSIVIDLAGDEYDQLIVEVADPDEAVKLLEDALKAASMEPVGS